MRFPERASEQRLRRMIVLIALLFTLTWLVWQWDVLIATFRLMRVSTGWPLAATLNMLTVLGIALGSLGAVLTGRVYGWHYGRITPLVDRFVPDTEAGRRRLERVAWIPVDVTLLVMPLLVLNFFALMPSVRAATPLTTDEMRLAYSGTLSLLVVVILAGARLSTRDAFAYLIVVHVARLGAGLLVAPEVWRDLVILTAESLVYAGLLASVSVNCLRGSQKLDLQFGRTTRAMLKATEETVRLEEEARADALVHEKVLASLLITSQAQDADRWETARRRAVVALEALDEIASPVRAAAPATPELAPTVSEEVNHALSGEPDAHLALENSQVVNVAGAIILLGQIALLVLTWDMYANAWAALLVYIPGAALILRFARTDPYGPGYEPRITWRFLVIALGPPAALAIGLSQVIDPAEFVAEVESWQNTGVLVAVMMLGMLLQSRLAWLSALAGIVVLIVWGVTVGQGSGLFPGGWPVLALGVGTTELFTRWSRRQVERGAVANATKRRMVLAEARQRTALESRRAHSRYVDDIVRPFLEQQVTGFPFTPATSARAAQLEARLRDDLRARCFRGTDIARAATDARARGVTVELLDDGALEDAPPALRTRVVSTALRALNAAADGAIVVRVLPPGREAVATVLVTPLDEPPRRTEVLDDGTVVYDGIPVRATREVTR